MWWYAGRFAVGAFDAAVLLGWVSIPLLMLTGSLLGTGQTLVDTAPEALIPRLFSRHRRRLELEWAEQCSDDWTALLLSDHRDGVSTTSKIRPLGARR
jgi:hypothetical protein